MEGKIRKIFPGANTANGSFNFFDNIIQNDINRIFCFKGGPGVGKSSLMKKIAQEFIDRGYDVELHHCPSDPSSLDALLIKKLGVVLLDGTSPHIVDPKDPGAIDEIVNLGEFWNVDNLEKDKDKIIEVGKDISASFRRAYKFLKSAEPIYLDIEEKYKNSMNFGKVNLLVDEFIEKLFKETSNSGQYKKERHLFGTAITPIGHIDYTDSILSQVKKVYYLDVQKGMSVEVYHYPLIKEKIETIIIKDLDVAITVSHIFEDREKIDLNQFIDKDKLSKYQEEIEFDKKIFNELINYAISNLKKAKSKHDIIEACYVPNMNFDEIEKLRKELVKRILKYENK